MIKPNYHIFFLSKAEASLVNGEVPLGMRCNGIGSQTKGRYHRNGEPNMLTSSKRVSHLELT